MPLSNKLTKTAVQVALRIRYPSAKVLGDGAGLYLRIRPDSSASWFFAAKVGGRRRELGLGSVTAVDLDLARKLAGGAREAIAEGRDPFAEKAAAKRESKEADRVPTFGEFAEDYIKGVEAGFRNRKHIAQWRSTLTTYAAPISKMRVDEITTDHVLKCLRPIWTTLPETAGRVRGRIERVLAAAKAQGLRPRDASNPAAWRNHLDILLPKRQTLSRGHHKALPFAELPAFIARLRERPALAARGLEFAILTAARTSEVLLMTWGEVDMDAALWVVPARRMKAGVEHRVPLSKAAVELLSALRPEEPDPDSLVFEAGGKPLSNMALLALLKRMKVNATTHGMRSAFRDFCGDVAGFPRELAEQALAHTIQNKAEAAYRRSTAVERRRVMMESWANFLDGREAKVVVLAA
jgi:integrase